MTAHALEETQDDGRRRRWTSRHEVVVLTALDGIEHDAWRSSDLERRRDRLNDAVGFSRLATKVKRVVERASDVRYVRSHEVTDVRQDGEREDVLALVLLGIWVRVAAKERQAQSPALGRIAVLGCVH